MKTLYGLIHNKQCTFNVRKDRLNKVLTVFNALTLKEKCLYLVKISKRNTAYQALVLMGLIVTIVTINYLFTI